ncbi:hypothetical protein Tco_0180201 [Tanacetum coccineum]
MAQQVIPAAQLVLRYHTIGRCNNYVMLQSIPCSPECKIVGQILLDHPLSYALTTTADVPLVYLKSIWQYRSSIVPTPWFYLFMLVGYQVGFYEQCVSEEGSHPDVSLGCVLFYWTCACTRDANSRCVFLFYEIRVNDDFKEYETVFIGVDVPIDQLQPVVSTQGTHRSTPRAYRILIVSIASPQGKKRKQTAGESSSLL